MPNIQGIRTNPWETYLTTVDAVETLTGYDFFSNLPEPIQNCIEAGTNGVNPKNDQTITFGPSADQPFGADVTLPATASSGLPVTLDRDLGPATVVNGTTLHFTGVGAVTVQATQPGDVNYNAAAAVSQSFTVTPGSQTIAFDAPAPRYLWRCGVPGDGDWRRVGQSRDVHGVGRLHVSSQPGVGRSRSSRPALAPSSTQKKSFVSISKAFRRTSHRPNALAVMKSGKTRCHEPLREN